MGSIRHPWICTHTNRVVNPLLPDENDIDINDISHALSNLCRFTGHTDFYSVAQHSVLVSYIVDPRYAKEALLHDAAEAYINDLNSPVKNLVKGDYARMESELEQCISKKFGIIWPFPDAVKEADVMAFKLEVQRLWEYASPLWKYYQIEPDLYKNATYKPIKLLMPTEAKSFFLGRYYELFEAPPMGDALQAFGDNDE